MLKYIGSHFYIGIPARDIDDDELAELEHGIWREMQHTDPTLKGKRLRSFLLESGQYLEIKSHPGAAQDKALRPDRENK